MESPIQRALGIYEILEQVLLQLNLDEIIRAQQICSRWKNVIQTSPALEQACWYRPLKETHQQDDSPELVELNPAFNRLGVSIQKLTNGPKQETGDFDLKKRIYDKPGSWTTMLATQPPVRCIEMECFSDYSGDQSYHYIIESMSGCLLLGDVMAVLAECQNRQFCDIDRWGSLRHFTGSLYPYEHEWSVDEKNWDYYSWELHLKEIPDDVSVKVGVSVPWGTGIYPAFALRRLYPGAEKMDYPFYGRYFLHELIIQRMIDYSGEYRWGHDCGSDIEAEMFNLGEYEANLVVIKECPEDYLEYSRTLRSTQKPNEDLC